MLNASLRLSSLFALFAVIDCVSIQAQDLEVDPARIVRRMDHFIVNETRQQFELTSDPLPFVDWGLVNPGFVEYVSKKTGQIIPLSGPHPHDDPNDIRAVTFAAAKGVRLHVQQPVTAGKFADVIGTTYPWERGEIDVNTVIYDEQQQLYRAWYKVAGGTAYAVSRDFKSWAKPLRALKEYQGHRETNLIGVTNLPEALAGVMKAEAEARPGASGAFFIDPSAPPDERFKTTFLAHAKTVHYDDHQKFVDRPISPITGPGSTVIFGAVSADGLAWRILPKPLCYHDGDTQTVTKYDTQLKKYVAYTRLYELARRTIAFTESADFREWPLPVSILTPGTNDSPSLDFYSNAFSFYPGQPGIRMIFCAAYDRTQDNADIRLASSRNGRVFHFLPGDPVIVPAGVDEPGHGMLIPKPGLVRLPDRSLMLVYGAWRMPHKFPRHHQDKIPNRYFDLCAKWPADRMVALEAVETGEFTSVPFVLRGNSIEINFATSNEGHIQVEVRDETFKPIPSRTFQEADQLKGDQLACTVTWNGARDLSAIRSKLIWLNFRLNQAKLFSIRSRD